MVRAVMTNDDYVDLVMYYPYEVEKVDKHVKLKNNPGMYDSRCFLLLHNGKEVSCEEANRLLTERDGDE